MLQSGATVSSISLGLLRLMMRNCGTGRGAHTTAWPLPTSCPGRRANTARAFFAVPRPAFLSSAWG